AASMRLILSLLSPQHNFLRREKKRHRDMSWLGLVSSAAHEILHSRPSNHFQPNLIALHTFLPIASIVIDKNRYVII
ncbi:hypothetical protein WCT84_21300, partial [Pectobacterium brasiliense]|uniref:hypothetical protein n=1 Tax=Pectobacterium brasiliense TaxID=180957 RepID=UPI003015923E